MTERTLFLAVLTVGTGKPGEIPPQHKAPRAATLLGMPRPTDKTHAVTGYVEACRWMTFLSQQQSTGREREQGNKEKVGPLICSEAHNIFQQIVGFLSFLKVPKVREWC